METKLYVKEGVGFQGFHSAQRKSNKKGLLLVAFLIIVAASFFIGPQLFNQANKTEEIVPSPTPLVMPTDIPTPTSVKPSTAALTPTLTPKPTVKVTTTPSPSPTKAPAAKNITVEVLNGSGEKGAAQDAASLLEKAGYTVSRTGNAGRFDYEGTTILAKTKTVLDAIKKELGTAYTISSASATLSSTATVDARIIIGKE